MITMKKISVMQLPMLVLIAYDGDTDLLDKYHISKLPLMGAVKSTLQMIFEMAKIEKLNCYKIVYQKKPIGYVVSYKNVLYSFGVNKAFRKREIMLSWWEELKQTIGRKFVCRLYRNNTRAIEFLKKQQMEEIEVNEEHNFITLLNSK
jgi:hypothetical protein